MSLEKFAKDAGVELVPCDKAWGGSIGYKMKDNPNVTYCGFRTEKSAYKHWLSSTFGEHTSKAILKLITKADKK